MAEYINKQDLIKTIVNAPISWDYPVTSEHLTGSAKRQNEILTMIDDVPTTDVREDIKGEWIYNQNAKHDAYWQCSICGNKWADSIYFNVGTTNFCPNCGADMRKTCDDKERLNNERLDG